MVSQSRYHCLASYLSNVQTQLNGHAQKAGNSIILGLLAATEGCPMWAEGMKCDVA